MSNSAYSYAIIYSNRAREKAKRYSNKAREKAEIEGQRRQTIGKNVRGC